MKKYMFTILTILLILGVVRISHAHEDMLLKENNGLGLSVYESIEKQQQSHRGQHVALPKQIIPETIHYDETRELQPDENIYEVQKAKSPVGFLCGRCNFLHYNGGHPDRDCCLFGLDQNTPCFNIFMTDILANGTGAISYIICGLAYLGPFSMCKSASCIPQVLCLPIFLGASSGCMTGTYVLGCLSYECAKYQGNQDFVDSYDRGQLCLPDDLCSYTNLTGISLSDWKSKIYDSNLYKWFQRC